MSENSSKSTLSIRYRIIRLIGLVAWVFLAFAVSQIVVVASIYGLDTIGVQIDAVNPTLLNTLVAAAVYVLTLLITIGGPYIARKKMTRLWEVGLSRLPSWTDIGLALLAALVYFILTASVLSAVEALIPGFNANEKQEIGFASLGTRIEYVLAFLTLVVIAPIAEEAIFRGYLFGKLRRTTNFIVTALMVSLLFGFVHGQWNVGIDTFVLSLVLCGLREVTGSIWAGILLHMIKNGIAFYFLFINTGMLGSGGQ